MLTYAALHVVARLYLERRCWGRLKGVSKERLPQDLLNMLVRPGELGCLLDATAALGLHSQTFEAEAVSHENSFWLLKLLRLPVTTTVTTTKQS